MKVLDIEPTDYTPGVLMNPDENSFVIWGKSRPEDARAFYMPIFAWLDEYYSLRYWKDAKFSKKPPEATFEFKLEYLNSTSAKFVLDILVKLIQFREDNIEIKVQWYYDEEDLDMKESGEAFERMCKMDFEFIAIPM